MRTNFVARVLGDLVKHGEWNLDDRVLAVCAGLSERDAFQKVGIRNAVISSLDPTVVHQIMDPFEGIIADVRNLPYKNDEFDWVFVSDGLHHCDSPHSALLEMYRVASRGVIVYESRDSLAMRIAVLLHIADEYEIRAVAANGGTCAGVNYTSVPNFVYRWTEREFKKVISCANPTGRHNFQFFYWFDPPARGYQGLKFLGFQFLMIAAKLFFTLFKKQSNSFCMVATKPQALYPWLVRDGTDVKFDIRILDKCSDPSNIHCGDIVKR